MERRRRKREASCSDMKALEHESFSAQTLLWPLRQSVAAKREREQGGGEHLSSPVLHHPLLLALRPRQGWRKHWRRVRPQPWSSCMIYLMQKLRCCSSQSCCSLPTQTRAQGAMLRMLMTLLPLPRSFGLECAELVAPQRLRAQAFTSSKRHFGQSQCSFEQFFGLT